ncbi:MAG: hypothetical protein BWY72_02372 [Bacteroidetes bacterium ADurb.Bin416]|nr:MAG: hypothetical protein BWY72_02372 [Bacteroidetes bacterium ADurb.Bin416]
MYISLDGGQQDAHRFRGLLGLLSLNDGFQQGNSGFHHTGTLDDLRQEHLPGTEEVTHRVHALHQGLFDDVNGVGVLRQAFGDIFLQMIGHSPDQCILQPFFHAFVAPTILNGFTIGSGGYLRVAQRFRIGQQRFSRFRLSVQYHVFG